MNDAVMREGALAALGSYLLILSAHVLLPATAPFALFLAAVGLVTLVLRRTLVPTRPARAGRVDVTPVTVRATESAPLEATFETLAALEAELHALEDQRLTELARAGEAGRPAPFRPDGPGRPDTPGGRAPR